MKASRPTFFNLTQIQMPVGACTSIAHRISGVLLALGTPFGIYLLDLSLRGQQGFAQAAILLDHMVVKLLLFLFVWALAHHLLAGLRHMLSDIDIGSKLRPARASAWTVNVSAALIALLSIGALF